MFDEKLLASLVPGVWCLIPLFSLVRIHLLGKRTAFIGSEFRTLNTTARFWVFATLLAGSVICLEFAFAAVFGHHEGGRAAETFLALSTVFWLSFWALFESANLYPVDYRTRTEMANYWRSRKWDMSH